jgi:8-oxo-dGTP diphosphatase
MITVVAALIERNGRLLVCQRRHDAPFPLKWEFPGGKLHPGETSQQALHRELEEELGVSAEVGREVYRTHHRYSEMPVELEVIFFAASVPPATAFRNLAFEQLQWVEVSALPAFDFLPADRELIEKLAAGEIKIDT